MSNESSDLTVASILAAASDVLTRAGYRRVPEGHSGRWLASDARVFEDLYSVVAVTVFDTWAALARGWPDAQGSLVELMGGYVTQGEAKSWDGYLVLMTPGTAGLDERAKAQLIERDTSRVRKLVATGEELRTIDDVEQNLLPLLPVATQTPEFQLHRDVLDLLPALLARRGVSEDLVRTLVGAFAAQEPLLESLHEHRQRR